LASCCASPGPCARAANRSILQGSPPLPLALRYRTSPQPTAFTGCERGARKKAQRLLRPGAAAGRPAVDPPSVLFAVRAVAVERLVHRRVLRTADVERGDQALRGARQRVVDE